MKMKRYSLIQRALRWISQSSSHTPIALTSGTRKAGTSFVIAVLSAMLLISVLIECSKVLTTKGSLS